MQTRRVGDSDLVVPAIGFGCWELSGDYGPIVVEETIAAIYRALDLGVTLFDTARAYGNGRSETLLGQALGSRRHEATIITKGGLRTRPDQPRHCDSRYEAIIADCEESLRALQTDYIDLYLVHWPDLETPFEEPMRAFNDLRSAGKVRYVGASNFGSAHLRECRQYAPIIADEVGYNLFDRRFELEMMPAARELGIGVIAYAPLAQGLLSGTFTADSRLDQRNWRGKLVFPAGMVFGQPLLAGEHYRQNLVVVDHLKGLAARKGVTLPQLALAWVLSNVQVAAALSGTRRPAEIEENALAAALVLTPEDQLEIEGIMKGASGQTMELPTPP